MLIALMRLGLNYREARNLSMEEVMCLLHHAALDEDLRQLDAEAARVASLSFADEHEQRQVLVGLEQRAATVVERFYRRHE